MLTREHRLTSSRLFTPAVRRGRRAGSRRLVVHLLETEPPGSGALAPRVGFVVSKGVGNAVHRNRVRRRLRHLMRERVQALPPASLLVVRALPTSAAATSAELAGDLDRALAKVSHRGRVRV